jgi:hypothetical protein
MLRGLGDPEECSHVLAELLSSNPILVLLQETKLADMSRSKLLPFSSVVSPVSKITGFRPQDSATTWQLLGIAGPATVVPLQWLLLSLRVPAQPSCHGGSATSTCPNKKLTEN